MYTEIYNTMWCRVYFFNFSHIMNEAVTKEEAFYKSLPCKRMAAGVLFFNDEDKVLLVKMSYKDGWGIPGGVVDANESPLQGALREVQEELNLTVPKETLSLVCLGYTSLLGAKTEALQLHFMEEYSLKNRFKIFLCKKMN